MKSLFIILIALTSTAFAQTKEIKIGDKADHYPLKLVTPQRTIDEKPLSELKGKPIVIQWMTRGCAGSKEQLKEMNSFYQKYGKDVFFTAVVDDPIFYIASFKQKNSYTFAFAQDKGKMNNDYFYFTAGSHMAIINRDGTCIYRGSPNLSDAVLDTLIAANELPQGFAKAAIDNFHIKEYGRSFEEYSATIESILQTSFKLEPYQRGLITNSRPSPGQDFYGYNVTRYDAYKNGLLLTDAQIIAPERLKRQLSNPDTSNLFMVGFNINKRSKSNKRFRRILKNYLDKAFGLETALTYQKQNCIILTNIRETGKNTRADNSLSKLSEKGDTMILSATPLKELARFLQHKFPSIQISAKKYASLTPYNLSLALNTSVRSPEELIASLNAHGIEAKLEEKWVPYLTFTEKDEQQVSYIRTKLRQTTFSFGYHIGKGISRYNFNEAIYEGNKASAIKAGIYSQVKLTNYLAINPELNYQTYGSKGNFGSSRLHSVYTPVNLVLSTNQQNWMGLYIKSGGYYSYNFGGKVTGSIADFSSIKRDVFGFTYGFGIRFSARTTLDFSYYRGLSKSFNRGPEANERGRHMTLGFRL